MKGAQTESDLEGLRAKAFKATHRVIGDVWSGALVQAGAHIKQSDFRYITFSNGQRSCIRVGLLKAVSPNEQ